MIPENSSRRQFLTTSTAAVGATLAVSGVHSEAAPRDEPIRLGIIGCGGIMSHHVKGLVKRKSAVEFAWLCDVDEAQIATMSKHVTGFQDSPIKRSQRYEDVIADKSVEAVIIATPHHWHAPIAIEAMKAGKDCYIEKPISHVFDEGPLIIAAAKKYGRVVQQGSQMRNSPVTLKAERLLKSGIIGKVKVAKAWTAEMRQVQRPVGDGTAPSGVDYDRWLGPAPSREFNSLRFHGSWRLFQDYGNGEIGDDGIHDLDMAAWGLNVTTLPRQITSRGSRMMLHGHASEYPDNMTVSYEYPNGTLLIYENYPFTSYGLHGFDNGNVFYGTEGYMVFSRRGAFSVFLGPKATPGPTEGREIRTQRGYAEHMNEFLRAIRTRAPTKARPEVAHLSCALVHLGEIAYRTTGRLEFDHKQQKFVGNEDANRLLTKAYRKPYSLPSI